MDGLGAYSFELAVESPDLALQRINRVLQLRVQRQQSERKS